MKRINISPALSALVVRCLQTANQSHKSMSPQEIAQVTGKEVDVVVHIQNGQLGFTIDDLLKLGEACGQPISLLVQGQIKKRKNVHPELKEAYKNLNNLLKARARLHKSMPSETTPAIPTQIKEQRPSPKKPVPLEPVHTKP